MDRQLIADPQYLHELANRQRQSAARANDAAAATDGVSRSLWVTHGPSVFVGNIAFGKAADARRAAAEAMGKLSESLAEKLDSGAIAYATVDEGQAGAMESQLQP